MKPEYDLLRRTCPGVDEGLIREHLSRLEERYFDLFSLKQIGEHLRALNSLSTEQPVKVLLKPLEEQFIECTVLAFDYPGEFSAITGILAASGLNILSGDVFTYERASEAVKESQVYYLAGKTRSRRIKSDPLKRRRIIDHLSGNLESFLPFEIWENRVKKQLTDTIGMLERGDSESFNKAKQQVNELVAERLSSLKLQPQAVLYPVQIEADNESAEQTRLKVVTQDTPFFLYALSTALSLRSVSIESIRIRTIDNRIEDEFCFLDAKGKKIIKPDFLNQVKLSVLLTKQFTYFLGSAPDPYSALYRFEQMVEEIFALPEQGRWFELLSDPLVLKDLARLLGASDFLWEDFIRLHYETLLPMLEPQVKGRKFSRPIKTLKPGLKKALFGASSLQEQRQILNEFKDREIFLFELDHILNPEVDFRTLSESLTCLAETVIDAAVQITYDRLKKRYGTPQTFAGLEARYAVLGLGKLGGGELGYASDIELLFVYSDSGVTRGQESIRNAEFFERLVRGSRQLIRAKQEGIFHVDMRLRPYGSSGPLACSLEMFCQYYGRQGDAHSLERLSLVRLRAFGGNDEFGARLERLRDELVYTGKNIELKALRSARQKQLDKRTKHGELNAKFSPGALVDLEYTVLLLQIMYGADHPELRTPRIREALDKLEEAGILAGQEAERIKTAYRFFRRLINSLRMLRGSARDLFLPQTSSEEYVHLARRMGYEAGKELTPGQQLHLEFETHTASIRAFVEQHMGRESLPGPAVGNIADLILSESIPTVLKQKILSKAGFRQPERAYVNLQSLAGSDSRRSHFAKLAVLAADLLQHQPDPDMALNNWERFIRSLNEPDKHFQMLLSQPRRLEILLSIFAGSQFLSDTLILNPEFFEWVTLPEHLHRIRDREEMKSFFLKLSKKSNTHRMWLNLLRRYRRREILRIGIRDIFLRVSIQDIMMELSMLADAIIQVILDRAWEEAGASHLSSDFCIMALGKLGGEELNYSSDIDLLGITNDRAPPTSKASFKKIMEKVRGDLSNHSEEGYAYRVDLRLRPYGESGELVGSLTELTHYYETAASLWEIQTLLKARPVAGSLTLGRSFKNRIRKLFLRRIDRKTLIQSIETMRQETLLKLSRGLLSAVNIKKSAGGIRDVEFLVQGLQLMHACEHVQKDRGQWNFLSGNTLNAMDALKSASILPAAGAGQLKRDYLFLRRIEHYLQIFEDRQTHALPQDPSQLETLAKRMLGVDAEADQFLEQVAACLKRVQSSYNTYLSGEAS